MEDQVVEEQIREIEYIASDELNVGLKSEAKRS